MNGRVQKLKDALKVENFEICIEKARLVMESFEQTMGEPEILRRAKATAHYLDNKTIFIEDGELIVGNVASKPMGLEAGSMGPTWSEEELKGLRAEGYILSPEDEATLRQMDRYWKGRTLWEKIGRYYDEERLWPFIQSGILFPPWVKKDEGRGHGAAGVGWGLGTGQSLIVPDFAIILNTGLNKITEDAKRALRELRFNDAEATKKADFLNAVIIANNAVVRLANRFADLASEMALTEQDSIRKSELEKIAEINLWVPANPARNFREAIQSFWYMWALIAHGAAAGGRFDQYMHPFYKQDKEGGRINPAQAIELLECLRIKVMQLNGIGGGKSQREKWAGMARWNNWVIGGVTPEGEDATNELTYLILEAAKDCQTPHHTITLRVHDKTPEDLLLKSLEVVKTGVGMPAFVGDKSYIGYFTRQGASLREARDYALAGCLDGMLPGKSRNNAFGMFIVPLVFEITLHNGVEPRSGRQLGPQTGDFESFESFEAFMAAFKTQLAHFMNLANEEHNILLMAQRELFPEPIHSIMMADAIKAARDVNDRVLPFENGSAMNPVGVITVVDSMAAIKKLVFEEQTVSKKELKEALAANWQGFEKLHKQCLDAPKYGNGNLFVDSIAGEIYRFWADETVKLPSAWGGTSKPAGVSITAYGPAGAITGATPDGRYAGENLCDGTMSAAQGRDTKGPTALLRSAMTIDQVPYQSTLLNLKFHPAALQTEADLKKLAALIRIYFATGGKHIQFNVVNRETLLEAQKNPEKHRDLIVRVAGYSAYFVQLNKRVQDDIIARAEHELAG